CEGFKWFLRSAKQGDPHGQHLTALCYLNGWGVKKDLKKMESWKVKAAEAGHLQAQVNMSVMLIKGEHLEKDPARATRFLEMAARQGHVIAQEDLALYYFQASDGEKDLAKAFFWASVAKYRSEKAKAIIDQVSVDLQPQVILEQMMKADEYLEENKAPTELPSESLPKNLFKQK
ncbi:MAG TPA: hypothetical protein DGJ56_04210, partial [Verrucomicrobiales bacterium]|nr:hypothetical protein [Verrucomicrobiales bacterium]